MELQYAVGIGPATSAWAPGTAPLQPHGHEGRGKQPTLLRRGPGHELLSVKEVALGLKVYDWRTVAWREGTNATLSSRFARLRVRPAQRDYRRSEWRAEVWLLIEWPRGEKEPTKYWLSNLPSDTGMEKLVATVKMRWRIERDYEELKQELGLGHYEGRGWRGLHHHASLCITAYGFLLEQRLRQKKARQRPLPALPEGYRPRGAGTGATSCA